MIQLDKNRHYNYDLSKQFHDNKYPIYQQQLQIISHFILPFLPLDYIIDSVKQYTKEWKYFVSLFRDWLHEIRGLIRGDNHNKIYSPRPRSDSCEGFHYFDDCVSSEMKKHDPIMYNVTQVLLSIPSSETMSIEILMGCIPAKYSFISKFGFEHPSSAFKDLPRYWLDYLVNGSFEEVEDKRLLCWIYAQKLDAKHLLIILNRFKQKMLEKKTKRTQM
jgi:hypothetical protein